jgi:hypothetical protein
MLVSLFNANGLSGRLDRVLNFQEENKIDLMLITETHFTPNSSTKNPIFSHTKTSDGTINGGRKAKGGIAGYLHHTHDPSLIEHLIVDPDCNYVIFRWCGAVFGLGYFPPDHSDIQEKMFELIEQTLDTAADAPCVILGDFNARMGAFSGDSNTNPRGMALKEYLQQTDRVTLQLPEQGIWTSFGGATGMGCGVTDIVLCGGGIETANYIVYEENSLGGSDHRPLVFNIPTGPPPEADNRQFERFNIRRFMNEDVVSKYTQTLDARIDEVLHVVEDPETTSDTAWQTMKGWIHEAGMASCGLFRFSRKPRFAGDFFTLQITDLQEQVVEKESTVALLRRDRRTPRPVLREATHELSLLNKELNEALATRRRDLFHVSADNLAHPQEAAAFLRRIKGQKEAKAKRGCQLDPARMNEHEAYFKQTFGADSPDLPQTPDPPIFPGSEPRPVSYELAKTIISKVALGKAAGCDGIPGEFYAYGGGSMVRAVAALLTKVCSSSQIPEEWTVANIVPVYKNKGDITKMENYRPIALTCVIRRMCEQVLIRDLEREISCLHDNQGGFRLRRSTLDQAFCLHEIMVSNPGTHLVLLDFKAAYDTVDRRLLWQKLRTEFHVPPGMVFMLSALFDHNSSTLLIKNSRSSRIPNKQGLLQGSSLSPLLFNFFIDSLARELHSEPLRLRTGGQPLNSLLFADDVVLCFQNIASGRTLVGRSEDWARRNNMRFAPHKCIHIAPTSPTADSDSDRSDDADTPLRQQALMIYNTPISKQASAKYLGLYFNALGLDFARNIQEKCVKAQGVTKLLGDVGMNGNGWVYSASALAYKMFIRPVLEYGIALKPLSTKEVEPLQKCQSAALRKILGAPSNTSIGAMHALLLMEPMSHRNLILNAQFSARLFNNNDQSIPAVRIWWNKIAMGKQSKLNPEAASLVQLGTYHNPLYAKASHISHVTTILRHPRRGPELSAEEASRKVLPTATVVKAFTGTQKKTMARAAIIKFKNSAGKSVSNSFELNHTEGYRAICLPNPDIPRNDRLIITKWLLGTICQHQNCANCEEAPELSREHGLECAGAREWCNNYFAEDMPEVFDEQAGDNPKATWLDRVLNAVRHNHEGWVNTGLSQTIQVILIKCRGLVQRLNGYWGPPLNEDGDAEAHAARWPGSQSGSQAASVSNVNYSQVGNQRQTAQRAETATLRNRQRGRPTANNPNRLRYGHHSLEALLASQASPHRPNEEEGISAASTQPCLPFSSEEVFNGGHPENAASQVGFFEDDEAMNNWATQGLAPSQATRMEAPRSRSEASSNRLGASKGVG